MGERWTILISSLFVENVTESSTGLVGPDSFHYTQKWKNSSDQRDGILTKHMDDLGWLENEL